MVGAAEGLGADHQLSPKDSNSGHFIEVYFWRSREVKDQGEAAHFQMSAYYHQGAAYFDQKNQGI